MLFSARLTGVVGIGALGILCAACTSSRDEYDDYGDRIIDADTTPIDARIISEVPDVSGTFYVTARPPLPEKRVLHFISTHVFTPTGPNTGRLDWRTVPLDYMTLEVVEGYEYVEEDVEIESDGSGDIPLLGIIPGEANSISGSDSEIDATIHFTIMTADFACGSLTGEAGPLNLEGSTFATQRIENADVRPLPDPIVRCSDGPTGEPDAGI